MQAKIYDLCTKFGIIGKLMSTKILTGGNINTTILVEYEINKEMKNFILQKINKYVFPNPPLVMANISKVTAYIKGKLGNVSGEMSRKVLNFYTAQNGKSFVVDEEDDFWRLCDYVENSMAFNSTTDNQLLKETGKAFGNFQSMLDGFPSQILGETIENFHNVPMRFNKLRAVVKKDEVGRAGLVEKETAELFKLERIATEMAMLLKQGLLPLRVTHNDTKCNNVLFDKETKKHLCVIDLDTVMPGSMLYDFGDSIRFGASTAAEDEIDLDKGSMDLNLFSEYTRGYLEELGGSITEEELLLLPISAKLMTLECGVRFLTDYLQGDTYFKIHRPEHNLDRARTQFKLVWDMEQKMNKMNEIVIKFAPSKTTPRS